MNTIHLQGLGQTPAIPVKDVQPGMVLIWNYGITSIVKSVTRGPKMVEIETECEGKSYFRRKRAASLVAVKGA